MTREDNTTEHYGLPKLMFECAKSRESSMFDSMLYGIVMASCSRAPPV